jgi:hypothetical protein
VAAVNVFTMRKTEHLGQERIVLEVSGPRRPLPREFLSVALPKYSHQHIRLYKTVNFFHCFQLQSKKRPQNTDWEDLTVSAELLNCDITISLPRLGELNNCNWGYLS